MVSQAWDLQLLFRDCKAKVITPA